MMACGRGIRVPRASVALPQYPPVTLNVSEKQATNFQNTADILVYFYCPRVEQRATYEYKAPFIQSNHLALVHCGEPLTSLLSQILSFVIVYLSCNPGYLNACSAFRHCRIKLLLGLERRQLYFH